MKPRQSHHLANAPNAFCHTALFRPQVATRGNTVDAHARSIQELAPRLTALINSNDLTDKLAGLNAIGAA